MLITCPECERNISNKAKKCPGCGMPMEEILKLMEEKKREPAMLTCPVCGFEFPDTEETCPKCGYPRLSLTAKAVIISSEADAYREKNGIKTKKVLEEEADEAKRREQEEAERRAEAERQRKDEEKRRRQSEEERRQKAEEERKHNEAFELVRERAEQGDANCQFGLGIIYRLGYGCKKNAAEAIQCFERQRHKAMKTHKEGF